MMLRCSHPSSRCHARLLTIIVVVLVGLAGSGCAAKHHHRRAHGVAAPRPAVINHLAFFKLKNPADAAELIADCDRDLGTLPMVTAYFCGQHLDTGRGSRIDSNYDVGFYVGFDDTAAYTAYVEHPLHQALVAKWQPRWEWIRVIDVLDDSP